MALNIEGDSDSTGSIAGQILGALHGEEAIPERWLGSNSSNIGRAPF